MNAKTLSFAALAFSMSLTWTSCSDDSEFLFPDSKTMLETGKYYYHTLSGADIELTPVMEDTYLLCSVLGTDFSVEKLKAMGLDADSITHKGTCIRPDDTFTSDWAIVRFRPGTTITDIRRVAAKEYIYATPTFGEDPEFCHAATEYFIARVKNGREAELTDLLDGADLYYKQLDDGLFAITTDYDTDGVIASADFKSLDCIEAVEPVFMDTYGRYYSPGYSQDKVSSNARPWDYYIDNGATRRIAWLDGYFFLSSDNERHLTLEYLKSRGINAKRICRSGQNDRYNQAEPLRHWAFIELTDAAGGQPWSLPDLRTAISNDSVYVAPVYHEHNTLYKTWEEGLTTCSRHLTIVPYEGMMGDLRTLVFEVKASIQPSSATSLTVLVPTRLTAPELANMVYARGISRSFTVPFTRYPASTSIW